MIIRCSSKNMAKLTRFFDDLIRLGLVSLSLGLYHGEPRCCVTETRLMYTTNGQSLGASLKNIYSGFEILSYIEHAARACSRNHGGAKNFEQLCGSLTLSVMFQVSDKAYVN